MKFFLHGGVTSPRTEKNKKFFQEVVNASTGKKILIVPFSHKIRDYDLQFSLDRTKFEYYNPNKNLEYTIASTDVEIIIQQIKDADILYFSGGLQEQHLEALRQIDNLEELLKDKIISGNSAGTMIRAKHFFSGDYNRLEDGLGILAIKIMVHWQSEKYDNYNEKELKKLEKYGEDLPVYKIREQEYVVLEK